MFPTVVVGASASSFGVSLGGMNCTLHAALPYTAFLCAFLQKYQIKYKCIIYPEIELEMGIKYTLLQLPVEIE